MARREKKPVHKVVMTEGERNIIQQLLQEYDIETAEDIEYSRAAGSSAIIRFYLSALTKM